MNHLSQFIYILDTHKLDSLWSKEWFLDDIVGQTGEPLEHVGPAEDVLEADGLVLAGQGLVAGVVESCNAGKVTNLQIDAEVGFYSLFQSPFRPTPAWKLVSMLTSTLKTSFHAGVGWNADWNNL